MELSDIFPPPTAPLPLTHGRTLTEHMFGAVVKNARQHRADPKDDYRKGALDGAAEVLAIFLNSYTPDPDGVVELAMRQAAKPRKIRRRK